MFHKYYITIIESLIGFSKEIILPDLTVCKIEIDTLSEVNRLFEFKGKGLNKGSLVIRISM